ncbi:spore germination lipoprotein GerD [Litchfieldia alkalitelluris]|uniref:spore germination lipoprotein GerD n=1 Tax=Litchfieldia alkalitelluris TaxID=304268 RepID=UPI000998BBB0|nr:spore germination lipoprotein GerD [Litchfieldia alkalitelluris]
MNKMKLLLILIPFLVMIGCAPAEQGGNQMDYDQTKKMVVDILKTDEGKKAIEEIMADESMQQKLVMDQAIVTKSIQTTLTSDEGIAFWKKAFEDPKFVETFAKSMQSEHEKLIKGLMKDPEYQGMMIDILKDPEMEKQFLEVLKSKEYREHLQTVMTETFESPLYQTKIQAILIKAAEDIQAGKAGKEEEK